MQLPLQVTFRHMEPSPALEARIRELASKLDGISHRITRCQVTVEAPHRHQQQGRLFEVRIDITLPGKEIAIRRTHAADPAHEDAYVALRDAFRTARRRILDYERKRFEPAKARAEPAA